MVVARDASKAEKLVGYSAEMKVGTTAGLLVVHLAHYWAGMKVSTTVASSVSYLVDH